MRRLLILLLALTMVLAAPAQKRSTAKKTASTTKTAQKKSSQKATSKNKNAKKATAKGGRKQQAYTTAEIKQLQNQQAKVKKTIRQKEQELSKNKASVKEKLNNLMVINSEIGEKKKSIEGIQKDIGHIDSNISLLQSQLLTLQEQLQERKAKYIKSMRYMTSHRTVQDKLMFVFSAQSFTQMYRRMRFVREYAKYQRVQGEMLKAKQAQVNEKHEQLKAAKGQKSVLLSKDQKAREELEGRHAEQQKMVKGLQKQQKTIQQVIDQQRQKDSELNAQIDRLIAIEVAKARARAEAEAKKRTEAAAAAKKKREAELARRKAEAEAAARANEARIAAAKERERAMKERAEAAERANNESEKARAEQEAREARAEREAAERKAKADSERSKKEIASAKKRADEADDYNATDRRLSGNFAANKGRLPMPITGRYKVIGHYGQRTVEGLSGVSLYNKGIDILGSSGAVARSVFDGEVSAVFQWSGTYVVMVRHGAYISVYCNLSSVAVSRGMKVSTRQALGNVGGDNILKFQLRKGTSALNPEAWID